eukprot:g47442.t1
MLETLNRSVNGVFPIPGQQTPTGGSCCCGSRLGLAPTCPSESIEPLDTGRGEAAVPGAADWCGRVGELRVQLGDRIVPEQQQLFGAFVADTVLAGKDQG